MKTRREAVEFIERQLLWEHETTHSKNDASHYGRQELRDLMDFLYGGLPSKEEEIKPPHGECWKSKD